MASTSAFQTTYGMRMLCDEMLKGLARWLRAAGYDVAMEPDGTADRILVERALRENRLLLTRDRSLLEIRHAMRVVLLLQGNDLESCVREITRKLNIDWLFNPFSRCSLCNTQLVDAERPADFPADIETTFLCPNCNKYYWHGGHVDRMRQQLERWQAFR